ncbi:MAG: DUF1801 domain-containing protein [Pseudomonadota bacterium]
MKAYASFPEWKKDQSPKNIRLIGALTRVIETAAPHLVKAVKWGQGCWVDEGEPKVFIHAASDHVQFGFYSGSALKDPKHLLVGDAKYVRHVKVRTPRDIDPPAFAALVVEACGL